MSFLPLNLWLCLLCPVFRHSCSTCFPHCGEGRLKPKSYQDLTPVLAEAARLSLKGAFLSSCHPSSQPSSTVFSFSFQPIIPSPPEGLLTPHLHIHSPLSKQFEFKLPLSSLQKHLFSVPMFEGLWISSKEDSRV